MLGVLGILAVPINLALFLPAVQAGREAARRASCTVKLKNIGVEIASYRQSHNGDYPPTLDDLSLPAASLQCPSNDSLGMGHDYVYAPPVEKDSDTAMIACEIFANHIRVRNVLFADGQARSMGDDEFQQELGNPENANLQTALSKVEGHGHGEFPHKLPPNHR